MKVLLSLIIALAIVEAAVAHMFGIKPQGKGEKATKCIVRDDEFSVGTHTLTANSVLGCAEITCYADGSIHGAGCTTGEIEGCTKGKRVDPDSYYPNCCKREWVCNRDGFTYLKIK